MYFTYTYMRYIIILEKRRRGVKILKFKWGVKYEQSIIKWKSG